MRLLGALNRKLLRDLWRQRAQLLAIALVMASGVATYVLFISTYDSLVQTRDAYYRDYRFADVFAALKRAPEGLAGRLADIPGVAAVQTRVVAQVTLSIEGFDEPVRGRIVSLDERDASGLNQLHLRAGRLPDPLRGDEVVLSETFALAHQFKPDDRLTAIINGRAQRLRIVGIALSPEYIYEVGPGAFFPDHQRYGVMWMARKPLATAWDMDGAFNNLAIALNPDARLQSVLDQLDERLLPHGGWGAYPREDQVSHRLLADELAQLQTMAAVFPVIFLGVAAFLLNVVMSRRIQTEREQIATLRAFGYSRFAIGWLYIKQVLLISAFGCLVGLLLGAWLGKMLAGLYMDFYRFPFLEYRLRPAMVATAVLIATAAALLGTLHAVLRAARQPPALAMQPEAPAVYRATVLERLGLQRRLSQPSRMILRHIERRPLKALLTMTGLAMACGIMMVGHFQESAINRIVDLQFVQGERGDLAVQFVEPRSARAIRELASLPGVRVAEGQRSVSVRLRNGHRHYRTLVQGIEADSTLRQIMDMRETPMPLPPAGLVLTDHLGKILDLRPGDTVTVEVLEGRRLVRDVPVVGFSKQYLGVMAFMDLAALNRLLGEPDRQAGAWLLIDENHQQAVYDALRERPGIIGTAMRKTEIASFMEIMEQTILYFTGIATILGAIIAFGVVYNSARIALAEHARELASLRVLGFTRGEIAYILLGELGLLTLLAIPLGLLIGFGFCAWLAASFQSDLYRIPLVIPPSTYAFAASVVLACALASGWLLWRKLSRLDMVAVLKTRE